MADAIAPRGDEGLAPPFPQVQVSKADTSGAPNGSNGATIPLVSNGASTLPILSAHNLAIIRAAALPTVDAQDLVANIALILMTEGHSSPTLAADDRVIQIATAAGYHDGKEIHFLTVACLGSNGSDETWHTCYFAFNNAGDVVMLHVGDPNTQSEQDGLIRAAHTLSVYMGKPHPAAVVQLTNADATAAFTNLETSLIERLPEEARVAVMQMAGLLKVHDLKYHYDESKVKVPGIVGEVNGRDIYCFSVDCSDPTLPGATPTWHTCYYAYDDWGNMVILHARDGGHLDSDATKDLATVAFNLAEHLNAGLASPEAEAGAPKHRIAFYCRNGEGSSAFEKWFFSPPNKGGPDTIGRETIMGLLRQWEETGTLPPPGVGIKYMAVDGADLTELRITAGPSNGHRGVGTIQKMSVDGGDPESVLVLINGGRVKDGTGKAQNEFLDKAAAQFPIGENEIRTVTIAELEDRINGNGGTPTKPSATPQNGKPSSNGRVGP